MDDSSSMGIAEPVADLDDDVGFLESAQLATAGKNRVQAFTLHELHHHVGIPAEVAQVVNRHDDGVLEAAERLGLAEEPLEQVRRIDKPAGHHLDRDLPIEVRVDGLINDTHTAATD